MSGLAMRRAGALVLVLIASILRFWRMRLQGACALEERARWVQKTCMHVLRSIDIRCDVEGPIPSRGLVVANHLSYLDVIMLSAAMPCFFVAKAEIDRWPYFGKAARAGGTLFIDRSSLASAEKVAATISERLKLPIPILFFPEGTSTDGEMRRFHSRLFQPAVLAGSFITPVSIRYVISDGTPERELCWFGDEGFFSNLLKTLKMPGIHAELRFGEPRVYRHRREAAEGTFTEIAAMREQMANCERRLQTA